MGHVSDLPQYQASPSLAQHSLEYAVADVKQSPKCDHKCTVSKGDRRRLWAAVIMLCIATGVIAVQMIVNGKSGPAHNNNTTAGNAPQHIQTGAPAVNNTISSLESTSQSPSTTSTMWSFVLIPSDAPSTVTFSFPSTLSATNLPAHGDMYQQFPMAALSKRATGHNLRITGPSLTVDGSDEPTFTDLAASTSPVCIRPQRNSFNGHKFVPFPPFWSTYSASPSAAAQHVAAPAAKKSSTPVKDKSAAKNKYVQQGDCATSSNARLCLRQGFDCVDMGDGAGPLCMGRQTDKQRGDSDKHRNDGGAKASNADHSRRNKLIGGILGGVSGLLLLLGGLWALWRHKCHKDQRRERAAGNDAMVHPVDPERAANQPAH